MVRGAGHDFGLRAVEMEHDHVLVIGEHTATRSDLVDQPARADLTQQEHRFASRESLAVLRHTY